MEQIVACYLVKEVEEVAGIPLIGFDLETAMEDFARRLNLQGLEGRVYPVGLFWLDSWMEVERGFRSVQLIPGSVFVILLEALGQVELLAQLGGGRILEEALVGERGLEVLEVEDSAGTVGLESVAVVARYIPQIGLAAVAVVVDAVPARRKRPDLVGSLDLQIFLAESLEVGNTLVGVDIAVLRPLLEPVACLECIHAVGTGYAVRPRPLRWAKVVGNCCYVLSNVHAALLHCIYLLDLASPFPLLKCFGVFLVSFHPIDHCSAYAHFLTQGCLENVIFPSFPVVVEDQAEDAVAVELYMNFGSLVFFRRAGK